jgi:hypothetical protein
MRLNIAKLPQDAATRWALSGLQVWPAREITQAIDSPAAPTFKKCWKRFKSDQRRSTGDVEASVVRLAWVSKPAAEGVIGPLKKEVRDGVKHRVLVDLLLLNLNATDLAEPVLVVFEHGTGQELVDNLRLSTCERH